MTDLDYTPPKKGRGGSGKNINGRIEIEFFGITEEALSFLHDELVETLDFQEKDQGVPIKYWRTFQVTLPEETE